MWFDHHLHHFEFRVEYLFLVHEIQGNVGAAPDPLVEIVDSKHESKFAVTEANLKRQVVYSRNCLVSKGWIRNN